MEELKGDGEWERGHRIKDRERDIRSRRLHDICIFSSQIDNIKKKGGGGGMEGGPMLQG